MSRYKVLLIGGTSHTGKSTVARLLAAHLGWTYRTTDTLARHPGRPWPIPSRPVPDHVAHHYLTLPVDELLADVLRHYTANIWPQAVELIEHHATHPTAGGLVIEGSAILPELAAHLAIPGVAAVWLTAGDQLLTRRIYTSSQYQTRSPRGKRMIDSFLARACRFNERTIRAVERLGLAGVDVESLSGVEELAAVCLSVLAEQGAIPPAAI